MTSRCRSGVLRLLSVRQGARSIRRATPADLGSWRLCKPGSFASVSKPTSGEGDGTHRWVDEDPYPDSSPACWNCHVPRLPAKERSFFCVKCDAIQPPGESKKLNYFELLEMDPKFDIEPDLLKAHYIQLARRLHPDKYVLKTEREQEYSKELSVRVNRAMDTLKDGVRRSRHLLKTRGVVDDFEEQRIDDVDFLTSVLELRQSVEDAESDDELRTLLVRGQELLDHETELVKAAFAADDLLEAKEITMRMVYYHKLVKLIREKLPP